MQKLDPIVKVHRSLVKAAINMLEGYVPSPNEVKDDIVMELSRCLLGEWEEPEEVWERLAIARPDDLRMGDRFDLHYEDREMCNPYVLEAWDMEDGVMITLRSTTHCFQVQRYGSIDGLMRRVQAQYRKVKRLIPKPPTPPADRCLSGKPMPPASTTTHGA